MLGNQVTRRAFLKGTATVAAAIPFIKVERLMNVWTPPQPEIFTGYSAPGQIITDPNTFNFSISGLMDTDQVYVKNLITGEVLINEIPRAGRQARWNIKEESGVPLQVAIRRGGSLPYVQQVGSPHPGGKTKISAIGLLQDQRGKQA